MNYRLLMLLLTGAFTLNTQAAVKTGLDRICSYGSVFANQRVGIIANQTAVDCQNRFIADVFAQDLPHAHLAALFAPEHGLWGIEAAGQTIENAVHPVYQVPVHSLYGKSRKPTPAMLNGLDVLVFDIQDIGTRFYTYIWTMALALEAAAEQGITFVVLDRPNPITGLTVQGNILETPFSSFVGLHPIPVVHGMTVGEMARLLNQEGWLKQGVKADLKVIPMTGWRRSMWYDQTGLTWRKPSPNMPDVETAAIYPGMALLEGTNVSEGRGTDAPFKQFGAPWIDARTLTDALNGLDMPGIRFEPVAFTPTSSKHTGARAAGAAC